MQESKELLQVPSRWQILGKSSELQAKHTVETQFLPEPQSSCKLFPYENACRQ